jgi:hypothetical protein
MEGPFEVVTRTMLDNPMLSVKVAHGKQERIYSVEMLPNPFGGVNTHLWRIEAYIVGIVPLVRSTYSDKKGMERYRGEGVCLLGPVFETEHDVLSQQKIQNHEAEDGDISFTEEARGGTDRLGMADDR